MPILPMLLVNGIDVSGNGWSTYVPKYNPRDIIANLRRLLNDECTETMHPWYRGFTGSIEKTRKKAAGVTYTTTGIIEAVDRTMLRITELPICCWTRDYKEFLQSLAPDDKIKGNETTIEEYSLRSDGDDVYIDIILSEEDMVIAKQEGLEKKFKLTTTIGPINMHLFDPNGNIRKYDTPEKILEEFFKFRLEFYEKRKVLDRMDAEAVEERRAMMEMHAQTAATRREGPKRRSKRTRARTQNVEPDTRETTEPVLAKRAAPRKKEPTKKASVSTLVGGDEENDMPRLKDRLAAFSINNFSPDDSENAAEPMVAKHTVPRKKPAKKASARVSGDDEDMPTLKNRLVAFSLIDSFPSHSAMESEITEEQQKGQKGRKAPSKRGTANKAPSSLGVLPDDDEVQDDNFSNEEASELQNEKAADMGQLPSDQPKCPPAGRPKRSRKPTWKIQDQMEAKGAAWPSNAICRASGA
ncbi:unnamed protein product [Urochloa decumbens]|uniref:DNA topoisomerase (ATP-hydrolyzing) n=1 Tax=Urochloa decumbens TaxID=240449 RepID=A0ABC9CEK6_9POAL